eukprot:3960911-Pyramimonas_sp.AAC.1
MGCLEVTLPQAMKLLLVGECVFCWDGALPRATLLHDPKHGVHRHSSSTHPCVSVAISDIHSWRASFKKRGIRALLEVLLSSLHITWARSRAS